MENDYLRVKLEWNKTFDKKFGSPKELVKLYNNASYIKELLAEGILFGEIYKYSYAIKRLNTLLYSDSKDYEVFKVNTDRIGFRICSIELNKEGDVVLSIIPVPPLGDSISVEWINDGRLKLHPRVPNLGTMKDKKLIPITFDFIWYEREGE